MASSTSTTSTGTAASSTSAEPAASSPTIDWATITAPPSIFTTPYAFPPECSNISWDIDVVDFPVTGQGRGGQRNHETYLYIARTVDFDDSDLPQYVKCFQPPGAAPAVAFVGDSLQETAYHAAVCPQDWQAMNVGLTSYSYSRKTSATGPQTWSTAHCCKSGDTLETNSRGLYYHAGAFQQSICVRSMTVDRADDGGVVTFMAYQTQIPTSVSDDSLTKTIAPYSGDSITTTRITTIPWRDVYRTRVVSTIGWKGGRAFYPAFSVEWDAEDNAALSPTWPVLTNDMLIPTWTPAMTSGFEEGEYDNKGSGTPSAIPLGTDKFAEVGVPIIATLASLLGVLLLAGVGFWLCRRRRAGRKELKVMDGDEIELRSVH